MRLIDADYFIEKLSAAPMVQEAMHKAVNQMPTVNVVRCKDCKHKPTGSGVNHDITFPEQDYRCPCRCEDYWYSWIPDDDWFCANGERNEID